MAKGSNRLGTHHWKSVTYLLAMCSQKKKKANSGGTSAELDDFPNTS